MADKSVDKWTDAEAFAHLSGTFRRACDHHPEIMEPWMVRVGDLIQQSEQVALMRKALASTIGERFPLVRMSHPDTAEK